MIHYILKEEVIEANKAVVSSYGQAHYVQQEANLEHVLDSAKRYGENIEDAQERVLKKAAFLLYHLAYTAHAFTDGNKRTAIASTIFFLHRNGIPVFFDSILEQEALAKVVKDTAAGKLSINALSKWLKGKAPR